MYIKKLDTNKNIHDMCSSKSADLSLRFKIRDEKEMRLTDFILKNSDQLYYSSTCCKPNPNDLEEFEFNFWSGFKAQLVKKVDMTLIAPILNILKEVWADDDENVYKVLLYFWSQILQKPETLPNRENAILLIGDQGIGKDFIVDFFQKFVIGQNHVSRLTGIEQAVGQFNKTLQNKVLSVINEMASTRDQFRSNFDKIKPLISNNEIMIQQKGVDSYPVENISSWLLFSNHEDVLYLEKGDRRYTCLRGNPKYKGNTGFFKSVFNQCFNQEAGNHMYSYLMNLQEEDMLHPSELKTTTLKEEIKMISLPAPQRFITEILEFRKYNLENKNEDCDDWRLGTGILSKDLYISYKEWSIDNGEKSTSNIKFGRSIKHLLPNRKRTNAGYMYILPDI
tara:strand:- start:124 stop:1305 length:1182 start_codon:yes stop_codon:yes gene_type:complete